MDEREMFLMWRERFNQIVSKLLLFGLPSQHILLNILYNNIGASPERAAGYLLKKEFPQLSYNLNKLDPQTAREVELGILAAMASDMRLLLAER